MTVQEYQLHLRLISVSAQLAAAVMENIPDTLPVDPETNVNDVQTANGMMFRLTRTFAQWIAGTLGSETYWPKLPALTIDPGQGGGGGVTPDAIKAVLPQLLADPSIAGILKGALGMAGNVGGGGTVPTPLAK